MRVAKVAVGVIVAAVLVLGGGILALWGNEIASVSSFHQIKQRDDANQDGAVYEMNVKGGFYLDEFVDQGGVKNDTDLIAFVTDNIAKGILPIGIENPTINCAAFTATTKSGDALMGRNYDMTKTNTVIVTTEAQGDRHASVSSVDLSYLGMDVDSDVDGLIDRVTCLAATYAPLDGMNDAGVTCGILMTYQGNEKNADGSDKVTPTDQNTTKPDFTCTTFQRMVLDYADDLDEAVEIAQAYDMHDSAGTSFHYLIADPSGRSAILEWVGESDATDNDGAARRLVVTYNDDDAAIGKREGDASFQWVTNFIIQPGYYKDSPESDMHGLDRYNKIYEQLSKADGVVEDEAAAMDILGSIGRRAWDKKPEECITVHSVVFNMSAKTVSWVPNEHYDDADSWFTYQL